MARVLPKYEQSPKKPGDFVLVPNYNWRRGEPSRKVEEIR